MMSLLAHRAEPVHNAVAHTFDDPVVATLVLAALITAGLVAWRIVRRRQARKEQAPLRRCL
jgi:hypothetical protein